MSFADFEAEKSESSLNLKPLGITCFLIGQLVRFFSKCFKNSFARMSQVCFLSCTCQKHSFDLKLKVGVAEFSSIKSLAMAPDPVVLGSS